MICALDPDGHLCDEYPCLLAHAFQSAILCYDGVSGTEDFFRHWDEYGRSWKAFFVCKHLQCLFLALDPRILVAAFTSGCLDSCFFRHSAEAFTEESE